MRSDRLLTYGSVAAAFAVLLTACGGSSGHQSKAAADTPQMGGSLVDLQAFSSGNPEHIDPALSIEQSAYQLDDLLYDGLTATHAHGTPENAVAASYNSNAGATVWTFKLRTDVHFSDGSPVLPSSFKRAWQRILNPTLSSDNASRMAEFQTTPDATTLDNVVPNDDAHTLAITLSQPDQDLPSLLALPTFSPMPNSAPSDKSMDGDKLIGDGPYVMDGPVQPNQPIRLSRNPSYFGGPEQRAPYLDHIEFRISQDTQAAYNDFGAGNGQIAAFPPTATADLQKYNKSDILNNPTMGGNYWGFNMSDPTVGGAQNLKLRQAIDMAIDKNAINQKEFGGTGRIASQFSTPNTPGSDAKPGTGQPDVAGAKRLLQEWGQTPPTIKLSFNSNSGHEDEVAIIIQNLAAVGIHAVANSLDLDTYRDDLGQGSLQFFWFNWAADYPSYRMMIGPPFSSAGGADSPNLTHYSNPAVDKLFADAMQQSSAADRQASYRQAEKLIMADQPVVGIVWSTDNLIKAPEVKNLTTDPLGMINYSDVWLTPAATASK